MADHKFIVNADPPEGVSDQEFFDWYDTHIAELLATVPGFTAAQRFSTPIYVKNSGGAPEYRHVAIYDVEGDLETTLRDLRSAVESGKLTFGEWFPRVLLTSYGCTPISARFEAAH